MANGAPSPTPAADWVPVEAVELPSGKVARLRQKLSLRALIRRGKLDLEELEALLAGELTDPQRALEIESALLAEIFVEPRVATGEASPKDGEIHADDLDDLDVQFALELALGGAPDLATFRDDNGGGEAGADSAGLAPEPEPATRSRARVDRGVDAGHAARGAPTKPKKSRARARAKS